MKRRKDGGDYWGGILAVVLSGVIAASLFLAATAALAGEAGPTFEWRKAGRVCWLESPGVSREVPTQPCAAAQDTREAKEDGK